jgi:hypothetical protein
MKITEFGFLRKPTNALRTLLNNAKLCSATRWICEDLWRQVCKWFLREGIRHIVAYHLFWPTKAQEQNDSYGLPAEILPHILNFLSIPNLFPQLIVRIWPWFIRGGLIQGLWVTDTVKAETMWRLHSSVLVWNHKKLRLKTSRPPCHSKKSGNLFYQRKPKCIVLFLW